jgi:hypothetical protein
MKSHIADEVKSGELTQAQADTKLAEVTTKATERVNSVQPARGHHNKSETAPNA